ncbi:ATPase [Sphingomonas paeninsulae]|uniref:ATPase n=1 Tax=Sphingomonas paeninsulae TaxID=2319844 RepID=A0A494THF1_SPHPE|nr:ATPase [Sphingomonas paeninsulae]AYJ86383.1 ATPase [Sphingomonas paeninsulae]
MSATPTIDAVLRALSERQNVLLSGPPSSGKTHLMQAVANAFSIWAPVAPSSGPRSASARIAIPANTPTPQGPIPTMPSPGRSGRHVERIAFSANTKARDFTSAFVPMVGASGSASIGFMVETGALIRANDQALSGGAALLVIDELNRGPAVQLFGDAIVSIETDKRLDHNDQTTLNSWPMRVLDKSGTTVPVYLSRHLYILSSINMADTSIEPLDVAFLRRFETIPVMPDPALARVHLAAAGVGVALPPAPVGPAHVTEAAVRAWEHVNERITIGRSADYQLGHGIFLGQPNAPATIQEALELATGWWRKIHTHVREVFYGDVLGVGVALNAGTDPAGYQLLNAPYGQDERQRIVEPTIDPSTIYGVLKRVSGA